MWRWTCAPVRPQSAGAWSAPSATLVCGPSSWDGFPRRRWPITPGAAARGSIMVTGSHIPFDRNGYKLNTSVGELLKSHEAPIGAFVARVRERLYGQPFTDSPFDEHGRF